MRWIRLGWLPVLLLTLASVSLADDEKEEAKSANTKHANSAKSQEDMSKKALAKWQGVLKLTDEQKPQFESVMKDSYQKMADAKKEAAGDQTKMKESVQHIMTERDEALSKFLTADQMKIYHEQMG